jgi:hypothetical protein
MTVRPLPHTSSAPAGKPSERHLKDFRWRLANLYHIKTKSGRTELLKPNEAQVRVVDTLAAGKRRLLTPKAREQGISTISFIRVRTLPESARDASPASR